MNLLVDNPALLKLTLPLLNCVTPTPIALTTTLVAAAFIPTPGNDAFVLTPTCPTSFTNTFLSLEIKTLNRSSPGFSPILILVDFEL